MQQMKVVVLLLQLACARDASKGFMLQKDPVDVTVHDKIAGNGYAEGSPLYERQEALKAGVDADGGVPPVSTTMNCVINLTIQYFILYTALAVVRTIGGYPSAQETLLAACGTVNYAPMLSVLFIGTRMRAIQLSEGNPDNYDLPQPYVKMAMQSCAWAVLVQTLIVLVLPIVLGETPKTGSDGTPEIPASPSIVAKVLGVLRWVSMAMLYGGFTTVCIGAYSMEAPAELWPDGTAPPVSPAVACTMNLAMQYFAVYLAIAVVQTWVQFSAPTRETDKLANILSLATNTVNFAPMLCILFIGARMRALQLDPKFGNPQAWAQNCFYLCTYSVLIQLALVIVVPYVLGGRVVKGEVEGDVTFELDGNANLFFILTGVRYLVMLALYGGFTAVIVSVFLIEAPDGKVTPPVSPTMQCVMNLTVQYFVIYLMLWLLLTARQYTASNRNMSYASFFAKALPTLEAAKSTVQFCPMLSVLFVGLRMRALQITNNEGAPQGWAQQGMFLSTYSVMLQLFMVLLMPLFTSGPSKLDANGLMVAESGNPIVTYVLTAIRYLALVALYGGAITCVVALFKITPETATGAGSLIPGVDIPAPPAAPTPE
jgi:hypothetical protein